jgi:hypothetical protein
MAASGAVATGKAPVNLTKMPARLLHPKKVRDAEMRAPRIKPLATRDYGKQDQAENPYPSDYGG